MSAQIDISTAQVFGVDRAILIDTPYCTAEEFARRTGQSLSTVRTQLDNGQLPFFQPAQKRKSRRLINMMQLAKEALEREEQVYD